MHTQFDMIIVVISKLSKINPYH
eukprot:SAG11_NODE_23367_length_390_cov_0.556701_1_plen_22_part_10